MAVASQALSVKCAPSIVAFPSCDSVETRCTPRLSLAERVVPLALLPHGHAFVVSIGNKQLKVNTF